MLFSPVYIESHPRRSPNSFLGLTATCPEQTRGISHSPSPVLLPTDHRPLTCLDPIGVPFHHCFKSFSCNTYRSPASVANKRLTSCLSPLDATLTKTTGRGCSYGIPKAEP